MNLDYELLAKHIVAEQKKYPKESEIIWGTHECADYLKLSVSTFRDRTSKDHRFPRVLGFNNGGHRSQPKWLKIDVIKWVMRHRT